MIARVVPLHAADDKQKNYRKTQTTVILYRFVMAESKREKKIELDSSGK